jgi:signal transduction histidine kinase
LTRGEPVIIQDVRGDDPLARAYQTAAGDRLETLYAYVRCFLAVPMTLKGQVIGALTLEHSHPGYYSDRHLALAMAVAQQAAIAIENARLYEQTVQRTNELSALLDVSRNVASTLELKPLLGLILDGLKTLVDYVACTLMSIEDGQSVALARRGPGADELVVQYRLWFEKFGPIADEIGRGRPVIIDDVRGDSLYAQAYRRGMGSLVEKPPYLRAWMAVPMLLKEQVAGALIVGHDRPGYFMDRHARLAQAMAQHAALAIENARLYDKAQQVAALEERQRLARELHDSVSQALFGIRLGARTVQALLERDPAQAARSIDYVLSLAQGGMAEMRALIFELRPESLEKEGVVQALTKQADAVRARHEIPVTLSVCDEPAVPLPVKEAFYRIAQEALHNTVKHAQPHSVDLSLEQSEGDLVLEVRDDGQGFDPGGSFPGHLGLQSMRERAQRVGGTVEIESRPRAGTRVRVRVPIRSDE